MLKGARMRIVWLTALATLVLPAASPAREPRRAVIIDLEAGSSPGSFDPALALGAGIDGGGKGEFDRLFTRHNLASMKSAGLRALTYRLRTELGIETWHWNPAGQWSDPGHAQGYWTSSDVPGKPIRLSWGYRLPRRGDTIDQANDDGWSRLTDGDPRTFWKSNPYLDPAALADGQAHPQWLMLHFHRKVRIDRAVIDWATPWATAYDVQFWRGEDDYDPSGRWITFPHGQVDRGTGGRAVLRLADRPVATTHVRIVLKAGSGTAPAGATDWRDRMGFAVGEVAFGTAAPDGHFRDAVIHAPSHSRQTVAHVSSTDPWHRAVDRDAGLEQLGIDRIFASGLGSGQPVMIPTGLLYDTPENEAAELRYVARRGYPVTQVELGEEPDGQYAAPADYAALYLAAVDRLKGILPAARFGGPSMQSAVTTTELLPETPGPWARWFVAYLKARGRLDALGFFSFEYYPFDDICHDLPAKLIRESRLLDEVGAVLDASGLPRSVPRIISEYGFSAYSGRAESDLPSGLLMASIVGQWLGTGAAGTAGAAYLFGYGPNRPANQNLPCAGYGNMMLFEADAAGQARQPMPSYHVARMLSHQWTMPDGGLHAILPVRVAGLPGREIGAWALRRPDHRIAVLAINRSAVHGIDLPLLAQSGGRLSALQGPGEAWQFGCRQFRWLDAGVRSRPLRSDPAAHADLHPGPIVIHAPPQSVQVILL